jgi:hypothetical protein
MKNWMVHGSVIVLFLTIHIVTAQWVETYQFKDARIGSIIAGNTGELFASTSSGIFLSTDNGTSWIPVNNGLPAPTDGNLYLLAVNSTNDLVLASSSGIFLSTNNGTTWTCIDSSTIITPINSLAVNGSGDIFIGMSDDTVFRYTSNGTNWTKFSSGVSKAIINATNDNNTLITCLAIHDTGDIFAGTFERGLYKSTDNGINWTRSDSGMTGWQREIRSLAINSTGDIFAGTHEEGVTRSTDNGSSWTTINSGFDPQWGCYNIAVYRSNIFIENSTGVFLSTNNGTNWTPVNTGLPLGINDLYRINSLVVNGNNIFTTIDSAVWRRPLSEMVGIINDKTQQCISQQTMFTIRTNGSYVTIGFNLPHSVQVCADIYNLSGHTIKSIINKYFVSGPHNFPSDTKNIPAGCYFLRMQAGSNSTVKNLLIFH